MVQRPLLCHCMWGCLLVTMQEKYLVTKIDFRILRVSRTYRCLCLGQQHIQMSMSWLAAHTGVCVLVSNTYRCLCLGWQHIQMSMSWLVAHTRCLCLSSTYRGLCLGWQRIQMSRSWLVAHTDVYVLVSSTYRCLCLGQQHIHVSMFNSADVLPSI